MESFDVIVIGAGAAGLTAARHLNKHKVLVLEARDRVGGRILDVSRPRIALGAEFIHGKAPCTRTVLEAERIATGRVPPRFMIKRDEEWVQAENFWRRLIAGLERVKKTDRTSFARALRAADLSREQADDLLAFTMGFHAADPSDVSAEAIASATDPAEYRTLRPEGGYLGLVRYLRRGISDLRLRHAVTRVDWRKSEVRVTARTPRGRRTFTGRAVIVTVPLALLKQRVLVFQPALTAKKKAIARLAVGPVLRHVLLFRRPFWPIRTSFFQDPTAVVPTWWTVPQSKRILVGWAGGPKARALGKRAPRERMDACLESLAGMFSLPVRKLRANLVSHWIHDWQKDPWSRGAYSYQRVGGGNAAARLAKPLGNRLFFAGEATDTSGAMGTVEGAIASGRRAAKEVVSTIPATRSAPFK